jgi:hypothetical protein
MALMPKHVAAKQQKEFVVSEIPDVPTAPCSAALNVNRHFLFKTNRNEVTSA